MDTQKPLVSILIPSYKPQHFEIALTSALAQTYANKEIIVSDDCPTDEIKAICAKYPAIQYSRNPRPGGADNIARLALLAKGEYLKYLFDDDILQPLCVSRMMEAFLTGENVILVFSPRDFIDSENRITSRPRDIKVEGDVTLINGRVLLRHCLVTIRNLVGEFTTAMFRKCDVVDDAGQVNFYDFHGSPVPGLGDIGTFIKLLEQGDAAYFSEPLSYFRVHAASNTGNTLGPAFRAAVADWVVLARYACAQADFSRDEKRLCLKNTRGLLVKKMADFPDLSTELSHIERLANELLLPLN